MKGTQNEAVEGSPCRTVVFKSLSGNTVVLLAVTGSSINKKEA